MDVESSICLSDLVPALRWSRPQQVAEALGDPRLPAGWWSSLALSKALGTAGLDWICERLARLATSRWDHLPLCDLLPALTVHRIDPALPGWPEATRTAIIGLGGWQRLRRLSPSDLTTPSATPEVVVGSVFREILGRIPAQREPVPAARANHPEVTRPLHVGAAAGLSSRSTGSFPAQPEGVPQPQAAAQPGTPQPAGPQPGASQPAGPQPGTSQPAAAQSGAPQPAGPQPGAPQPAAAQSGAPQPAGSPPAGSQPSAAHPGPQEGAVPSAPPQTGMFVAQSASKPDAGAPPPSTGPFTSPAEGLSQPQTGTFAAQPSDRRSGPQSGSFPAQPEGRQTGPLPAQPEGRQPGSSAPHAEGRQTGSFPAQPESGRQSQTGSFAAQPSEHRAGPQSGSFPAQPSDRPADPQSGSFPAQPDGRQTGSLPAQPPGGGPRQGLAGEGLPQRPAPGQSERHPQRPGGAAPGRQDTGSLPGMPGSGPQTGSMPAVRGPGPHTGSMPAVPGSGPHTGSMPAVPGPEGAKGAPAYAAPVPSAAPSGTAPSDTDHAMVRVVDSLFRSLDKMELAVAVHRLFAEDPVSLRTLAHKLLVDRDALSQAQRTAEERVLHWLRSSESAPVTGHMFRLTEWLGAAATEDQLIGADPAHPVTVPSLRTPLWRVLVTLMPDRRLQDGWLVVGDIQGLQSRTRQLLASSPPDADVVELMAELGIRAHSAKAWLDALPPETVPDPAAAQAPAQPLPRRTPGANGHHRGGQPIPTVNASSIDPSAALATLSALSGSRSGKLPGGLAGAPSTPPPPLPSPSSDPRRWQRIEVTPEHLRGGPVPVPEGYAAQLGMRPGTLLSVTGPGDNAIVLVWQGHQPVFDSLQPVLMRLNARPGDQVYVTVDGYRLEAQLTG
ncbi:hypothetical protein E1292_29050 [Nonomuraea deserti]|uniref:Uncharacterized protein n=1 Tax=Nonomuraea deserti TaxID=1848322 RepID=A0A4R4V568_9ACTN|nr:hypothetical protein [Nonomuraea deserti]TDD00339.1 hypothetical protein E1292_29050 [Nonomuraea deserti]